MYNKFSYRDPPKFRSSGFSHPKKAKTRVLQCALSHFSNTNMVIKNNYLYGTTALNIYLLHFFITYSCFLVQSHHPLTS